MISRLDATAGVFPDDLDDLADLLVDCVSGGAGVGFHHPLDVGTARAWWVTACADGSPTWVARDDGGRVVGCVRLVLAGQANGAHRAEVSKLLVRRDARGQGLATALLTALESEAARTGRLTLVLDTETGSPAEALYAARGWTRVGVVPDYATTPQGVLAATTIFTKRLSAASATQRAVTETGCSAAATT